MLAQDPLHVVEGSAGRKLDPNPVGFLQRFDRDDLDRIARRLGAAGLARSIIAHAF